MGLSILRMAFAAISSCELLSPKLRAMKAAMKAAMKVAMKNVSVRAHYTGLV